MAIETKDLRTLLVHEARDEARRDGARAVEAEHVLLALAATDTPAARMLTDAGLTVGEIRAALDKEWEQSLAVAGIAVRMGLLPPATPDPARSLKLGESVVNVLHRALEAPPKQSAGRIGPTRLLIGILSSHRSRVARALEAAGVDRVELRTKAVEALAQGVS